MKNLFLKAICIICFSISLVSCSNDDTTSIESTQTSIILKEYSQSDFELEVLNLINEDRVSKDLNAFAVINEISYLASTHDDYMILKGVAVMIISIKELTL